MWHLKTIPPLLGSRSLQLATPCHSHMSTEDSKCIKNTSELHQSLEATSVGSNLLTQFALLLLHNVHLYVRNHALYMADEVHSKLVD